MFSLFGAGMENSDAARMVGEWGCNNIILGGWATITYTKLVYLSQKAKKHLWIKFYRWGSCVLHRGAAEGGE